MKCPKCSAELKKVDVAVEGAKNKIQTLQCSKCKYIRFGESSGKKVIAELHDKETALRIQQKIVKLSHNRLGTYFNKHVIRSLDLKHGEDIYVSVPDKKHIIISLEE